MKRRRLRVIFSETADFVNVVFLKLEIALTLPLAVKLFLVGVARIVGLGIFLRHAPVDVSVIRVRIVLIDTHGLPLTFG